MTPAMKYTLLIILSCSGFVDGFLLFGFGGDNHIRDWFNPFIGMLYLIILPFWGAMIDLFPHKDPK